MTFLKTCVSFFILNLLPTIVLTIAGSFCTTSASAQEIQLTKSQKHDSAYTIALLLPFNSQKVFVRDLQQSDFYFPDESQIAVEFYQGAMLALDSLKQMGLNATVLVYDVGNDSVTVNNVLAKPQLKDANLIIGPLSGYALKATTAFSFNEHIPLVSPLSASVNSSSPNQFFILANATIRTHCEAIYDYLLKHELTHRMILLYRNKPDDLELVNFIKNYRDKQTEAGNPELKFVELTDSTRTTYRKLRDSLFLTDKNILLVPSNDQSFVRSVLKQVTNLKSDYTIEVFGMPTWSNFDLVPSENFDSSNVHLTSSFWLDRTLPHAITFKNAYSEKYKVNPSEYSVRGYDEMFYFGSHMQRFGSRLFLSVFPSADGLTSATAYRIIPVMRDEQEVIYRENQTVFFLQHQNGNWEKMIVQ